MRAGSMPRALITFFLGVIVLVLGSLPASASRHPAVTVKVSGNHLINGSGQTIRLLGVDRSGTEYACEEGWGVFDGPSSAASIAVMSSWHVNAVRLPLNEGCWLGLYTAPQDAPYVGASYRSAIEQYVALLHAHGMAVILDLASLDAPDGLNVAPMADAAHSPAFWSSVAATFKSDPGVLFDLYNEPHDISWPCWRNGCTVTFTTSGGTTASYKTAGMQSLVDAIRSAGATQPIMLGGLQWSSSETKWLTDEPNDPDHQLVVSFHNYLSAGGCNTLACWTAELGPLLSHVPVVTGESGEYDCQDAYVTKYMTWADAHQISYLGWAWDATAPGGWSCQTPSLITSYVTGAPTAYGVGLKQHLEALVTDGVFPPSLG